MLVRTLFAVVAVVAIPIAVNGEETATQSRENNTKRICHAHVETGSRLATVRRCRTRIEEAEAKQEAKQVVDRIQALKPTFGK